MELAGTYFHSLLIVAVALALLLLGFSLRRRWNARPTRLRQLLKSRSKDPAYTEYLVPLLVLEDRYPSFADILGLVLERFPLASFMRDSDFRSALIFLSDAAFKDVSEGSVRTAMAQIVRRFLEEPDIEYHCRPHLDPLIDRFLEEIVEERSSG